MDSEAGRHVCQTITDDSDVRSQKEVAFYSSAVQAWIATRMEKDRALLSLSAGGIALLVTLLTAVGPSSFSELLLYLAAALAFLVAIVAALAIFGRNASHLRNVVTKNERGDDPWLLRLDLLLTFAFCAGVALTLLVALSSGVAHLELGQEEVMGNEEKRETTSLPPVPLKKSLTGIGELRPSGDDGGSEQGSGASTEPSGESSAGTGDSAKD